MFRKVAGRNGVTRISPARSRDLGLPNFFVRLDDALAERKARAIVAGFPSQADKHWFSEETFLALMRLRGMQCAERYAEAFYARKLRV